MDSSRKFTFKLPTSSSSIKPPVGGGGESTVVAAAAATSIPFSIKKFSTSSTVNSTSILNYSSQGAKPLTTNKTKQSFEFNKSGVSSPSSFHQSSSKVTAKENTAPASKPSQQQQQPKVSNNKVTKHTAFQSQMTSFLATTSNKTFKKPGGAAVAATTLDSLLKDETDDDWAPIELKKTSPCFLQPTAAVAAKKNHPSTPLTRGGVHDDDDSVSAAANTCKAKLKFPSPAAVHETRVQETTKTFTKTFSFSKPGQESKPSVVAATVTVMAPKVTGLFAPKMPLMDKSNQMTNIVTKAPPPPPPQSDKNDVEKNKLVASLDAQIQQVTDLQANKCPVCLSVYNSKQNRKLTEECGHSVCVGCLLKTSNDDSDETSCVTCSKLRHLEETKNRLDEGNNNNGRRDDDDYDNYSEKIIADAASPSYSPPCVVEKTSCNNDDDDDDFIYQLDDFDLNPITSKKPPPPPTTSMANQNSFSSLTGGSNTSSVFDLGEKISRSFQNNNNSSSITNKVAPLKSSRPSIESIQTISSRESSTAVNSHYKKSVVYDSEADFDDENDDDDDVELIYETDKDNNQIFMVDQDDDDDDDDVVIAPKKTTIPANKKRFAGREQIDEDVFEESSSESQSSKIGSHNNKQSMIVGGGARRQAGDVDDDEEDGDDKDVYECQESALTYKLVQGVEVADVESYPKINWLFNDIHDCSKFFRDYNNYEHTRVMMQVFRTRFGLKRFRPQQSEAINAALLGNNVFILMPTGGGKSICYQLPAMISEGITFVVSPLKSLIIDQVSKLVSLGCEAAHLLAETDSDGGGGGGGSDSHQVYMDLNSARPSLKIIYITPEKLNNSGKFQNIITRLYNKGLMSRLVIDEAHCVSQWGHDFRKDYTCLGELRNRMFPTVPLMLLTATATPRVRDDILIQMKLKSAYNNNFTHNSIIQKTSARVDAKLSARCYTDGGGMMGGGSQNPNSNEVAFFMQSFNRENLQYKVEYKESNQSALEKVSKLIRERFYKKSGIVYCISRNECETVSECLRKNGIQALPYHAGMNDKDRAQIQHQWSHSVNCQVVCATIAFGMGIDKADVRFVIHLGLPKSLEGYYQESGRAGRDGLVSQCILFYNNTDRTKWLRIIKQEKLPSNVYQIHVDNIYRMSQYCDNRIDCRRAQILQYFGELFDRTKCMNSPLGTICDSCHLMTMQKCQSKPMTNEARKIIDFVRCNTSDLTQLQLSEILKGSMNKNIVEKDHHKTEIHSMLKDMRKPDIERLLRKLLYLGYLREEVKALKLRSHDAVATYIVIGKKGYNLTNFSFEFEFFDDFASTANSKKGAKKTGGKEEEDETTDMDKLPGLLKRCREDVDRLIKAQQTTNRENLSSVFTNKMIKEMMEKLPTTFDEILCITGYTESLYKKYQGDELLKIFKHYFEPIRQERRRIENEKRAQREEKLRKLEEKNKKSERQTTASARNSKTYGLIDEADVDGNIDYDTSYTTTPAAGGGYSYKRKASSSSFHGAAGKKKKQTGGYGAGASSSSEYFQNKGGYSGGGGGGGKKTFFKKKKFFPKKKS